MCAAVTRSLKCGSYVEDIEGWEVVSVLPSSAAINAEAASSSAALGSASMSGDCISTCRAEIVLFESGLHGSESCASSIIGILSCVAGCWFQIREVVKIVSSVSGSSELPPVMMP